VFVDGDLEVRFAARPTNGPQVPHQRDELYFVASGSGRYRVAETVTAVGPGDVLFCAAHVAHGFEDISEDFSVGPVLRPAKVAALDFKPIRCHYSFRRAFSLREPASTPG